MPKEQVLREYFHSHKKERKDNGFSNSIKNRLPDKVKIFPCLIILLCFILCFMILFISNTPAFIRNYCHLTLNMETTYSLPFSDLIIYGIGGIISFGSISYSLYQAFRIV